jgi:sugar phosphate isomerase/epimerase
MHPRVAVSTMSMPTSTLEEDCDWAVSVGFKQLSLAPQKATAAGLDALRRSGLAVATIVSPMLFALADPSGWDPVRDAGLAVVDLAAELGAGSVYGVTGPPGRLAWADAAAAYVEAIAPVRAAAIARGVTLALEPTNPLRLDVNLCHGLRDTVALARLAGLAVCADFFGMLGEAQLRETIASAADILRLVQVSDFVVGTLSTPGRAVPGDGDVDVGQLIRWVLETGYDGPFDLELNGPRIDEEGHRAAMLRAGQNVSALLSEQDA